MATVKRVSAAEDQSPQAQRDAESLRQREESELAAKTSSALGKRRNRPMLLGTNDQQSTLG